MFSFTQKTFAANGTLTSTQTLPVFPTFTVTAVDPGSSFLGFTCAVYDALNPAVDVGGGVLANN